MATTGLVLVVSCVSSQGILESWHDVRLDWRLRPCNSRLDSGLGLSDSPITLTIEIIRQPFKNRRNYRKHQISEYSASLYDHSKYLSIQEIFSSFASERDAIKSISCYRWKTMTHNKFNYVTITHLLMNQEQRPSVSSGMFQIKLFLTCLVCFSWH